MIKYILIVAVVGMLACNGKSPGPTLDITGYEREQIGSGGEIVGYRAADETWLAKGTLIDGVRNGTWISYHAGKDMIKLMTTYIHGKKNGVEMEFNDRGQMIRLTEYKNDELHGLSAKYQFGRPTEETHYKHGILDGHFAIYGSQGKIQRQGSFKNGKQHGTMQYFDQDGNVMLEYEYENGEKVSGGMVENIEDPSQAEQ